MTGSITIIFFMIFCLYRIESKCSFTVPNIDALPIIPLDDEPFYTDVPPCPMYKDEAVCCNSYQVASLTSNFAAIDATFGSPGGGCDICAANLKRFWCEYTCNPRQADFVKIGDNEGNEYGMVPDPGDSTKYVKVQLVQIIMQPQTACDIWSSCKRTQFASQVSAMQSPGGFFNFQGENAVSQAQQYITSEFLESEIALGLNDITQCNTNITVQKIDEQTGDIIYIESSGFQIRQNCSCNNCDLSCSNDQILYQPTGVWEGFNWELVLIVWAVVLFLSILITVIRILINKGQNNGAAQNLQYNSQQQYQYQYQEQNLQQPLIK